MDGRVLSEHTVRCEERRLAWRAADDRRWRAYWIDDSPDEKLLFYCPECARVEFGDG